MTRHWPLVSAFLVAATLLALAVGCGGGDDSGTFRQGRLTDPRNVPTATAWAQAPEPVIIDPNNIQPITGGAPTAVPSGATPEPGEPGVCGTTYTIESGDTIFGIADKCGVSPQSVLDANPDVDPAALHPGQVINIPPPEQASPTPEP